jgi:hypothetical protein
VNASLYHERLRDQGRYERITKVGREEGEVPSRAAYWWTCPKPCGRSHVRSTGVYRAPACKHCGAEESN